MKILFIYSKYDYGSGGLSLEELHMVQSLIDAGAEVRRFDFFGLLKTHGQQIMNELLRTEFSNGPFDVILYVPVDGREITEETWSYVEDRTPRVLWLFNDVWRFESFGQERCWDYEWVVSDDPGGERRYRELGFGDNVVYLPRACRTRWFGQPVGGNRPLDVVFVGQMHGQRSSLLKSIFDSLPSSVTKAVAGLPQNYLPWPEYVQMLGQAKIGLSLGRASQGDHWQIKTRDFEMPSAGALLLAESPLVETQYGNGEEFVLFASVDDAVKKIMWALEHDEDRLRIAQAGQDRAFREHDYRCRIDILFQRMGLIPCP